MAPRRRIGEFELIARYFAPLARDFPGAGGLKSDNAVFSADPRRDLVVKTDMVVSGVHFLPDEQPQTIAAKALRVCLSDLAAGGATPHAYQLALALASDWKESWIAAFARGLAADQRRYGVSLSGGDTVVTPGPLSVSITAFGKVARGRAMRRDRARAGDELWVTGTIGDGALGLLAARGRLKGITPRQSAMLEGRYRLPQPRCALGVRLPGIATASADVSDGLLADAGHVADASGLAVVVEREAVPLSAAARTAVAVEPKLWAAVLGGGDDYELVLAVPRRKRAALRAAADASGIDVTRIGHFAHGAGVQLMIDGRAAPLPRKGYVHF
ncbi:MAG: thiamine-phosphate kinase [Reyranella sp.]|uniref:thiamine-phosphate kinase n=1 Tax=Reyranella sp. TaxID=1929291 RepID=UPI0025DEE835|nr:thiamine-phosphate kinase [Reyranella sp.]MBR2817839.1 thiamine-phosphate kinase [Reyranella sp.]